MSVTGADQMVSSQRSSATPPSTNAQLRKIKKPLIERRRRERINECLNQLKSLVLEATNKDETRFSKMEKADILEMTVAHLKTLHAAVRARPRVCSSPRTEPVDGGSSMSSSPAVRYMTGFTECAREVSNYLAQSETSSRLSADVRWSLLQHLDGCLRVNAGVPLASASTTGAPTTVDCRPASRVDHEEVSDRLSVVSSPTPVAATVVSERDGSRRSRCDSGVYSSCSGASSPAQDDVDMAVAYSSTSDSNCVVRLSSVSPVPLLSALSVGVERRPEPETSSSVWRPW